MLRKILVHDIARKPLLGLLNTIVRSVFFWS